MKILLINKFHYLRGGAERAYFDTAKVLAEHGHDLAFFSMKHPENQKSRWSKYFVSHISFRNLNISIFEKLKIALRILYNFEAKRKLEKLIKDFKPDVCHMHGIYHQLSPSIIDTLKKYKIPMVMTLHDYKLISPAYNLLVEGKVWEKDKGGKYYKCIPDKCVKNSYAKSTVSVIEAYLHKFLGTYKKIDFFISPSKFLIDKFKEYKFEGEISKISNPVISRQDNKNDTVNSNDKYILYFGRLSKEKGIEDLIKAFAMIEDKNVVLKIVGEGPEEDSLKDLADTLKVDNIDFLGFKENKELFKLIANSLFVVVPSKWYENAPYSILESMSLGKAVVCSDLGGMRELVGDNENGLTFELGNINDLKDKIEYLFKRPELIEKYGRTGKKKVETENNKEDYYKKIINIYESLVEKNKLR